MTDVRSEALEALKGERALESSTRQGNDEGSSNLTQGSHQPVTAINEDASRETSIAAMPCLSSGAGSSAFLPSPETNLPNKSLPALTNMPRPLNAEEGESNRLADTTMISLKRKLEELISSRLANMDKLKWQWREVEEAYWNEVARAESQPGTRSMTSRRRNVRALAIRRLADMNRLESKWRRIKKEYWSVVRAIEEGMSFPPKKLAEVEELSKETEESFLVLGSVRQEAMALVRRGTEVPQDRGPDAKVPQGEMSRAMDPFSEPVEAKPNDKRKCDFFGDEYVGGAKRIKAHFAGVRSEVLKGERAVESSNRQGNDEGSSDLTQGWHQSVTASNEDTSRETSIAGMPYLSSGAGSSAFIPSPETNLPNRSLPALTNVPRPLNAEEGEPNRLADMTMTSLKRKLGEFISCRLADMDKIKWQWREVEKAYWNEVAWAESQAGIHRLADTTMTSCRRYMRVLAIRRLADMNKLKLNWRRIKGEYWSVVRAIEEGISFPPEKLAEVEELSKEIEKIFLVLGRVRLEAMALVRRNIEVAQGERGPDTEVPQGEMPRVMNPFSELVEEKPNDKQKCNFFGNEYVGGAKRIKEHFARVRSEALEALKGERAVESSNRQGDDEGSSDLTQGWHHSMTASNEDASRETSIAAMSYLSSGAGSSAFIPSPDTNLPNQSLPVLTNMPCPTNAEEVEPSTEVPKGARTHVASAESRLGTHRLADKTMTFLKRKLGELISSHLANMDKVKWQWREVEEAYWDEVARAESQPGTCRLADTTMTSRRRNVRALAIRRLADMNKLKSKWRRIKEEYWSVARAIEEGITFPPRRVVEVEESSKEIEEIFLVLGRVRQEAMALVRRDTEVPQGEGGPDTEVPQGEGGPDTEVPQGERPRVMDPFSELVEEKPNDKWKCNFLRNEYVGGARRIKAHFAGVRLEALEALKVERVVESSNGQGNDEGSSDLTQGWHQSVTASNEDVSRETSIAAMPYLSSGAGSSAFLPSPETNLPNQSLPALTNMACPLNAEEGEPNRRADTTLISLKRKLGELICSRLADMDKLKWQWREVEEAYWNEVARAESQPVTCRLANTTMTSRRSNVRALAIRRLADMNKLESKWRRIKEEYWSVVRAIEEGISFPPGKVAEMEELSKEIEEIFLVLLRVRQEAMALVRRDTMIPEGERGPDTEVPQGEMPRAMNPFSELVEENPNDKRKCNFFGNEYAGGVKRIKA